jgi:hypothetical protein
MVAPTSTGPWRRPDVVGISPDDRSLVGLASMLATEQNDEWLVGRAT